jgi:16S rRNA processing protein RimM
MSWSVDPNKLTPSTGSPPSGEPVFLAVGKLRRPHGVHGEMIMDILTDFPERLRPGVMLYLGAERQPQRVQKLRAYNKGLLIAFEGYLTPESLTRFRNQIAWVRADDRPPLPAGEYYHHQWIGLRIVDEKGKPLGRIMEILETGANDVLVVQPEFGAEMLLPVIDQVILDVNLEAGEMRVHVLPGILNENPGIQRNGSE